MPNKQLNFMDYYIAQLFIIARINKIEIACDGTHLCAQPHDPEAKWGFKHQEF
jgi:hypothetical protein